MITSTLDLATAIGAVVLMPLIIWANLNNRQSGIMAYLWRESPWLVRIGLTFLGLVWLAAANALAGYYGPLTEAAAGVISSTLGIPMLAMSLAILVMAAIELARYLRSRRDA